MLATAKSDADLAAHTFQTVTLPNGKGNLFDEFHQLVIQSVRKVARRSQLVQR